MEKDELEKIKDNISCLLFLISEIIYYKFE